MRVDDTLEKKIVLDYPLVLGGKKYKDVIIREYLGTDEEFISQPNIKNNLILIENNLIARCIAEVVGTDLLPSAADVSKLPFQAIENIMLEIREVSTGDILKRKLTCEKCKKPLMFDYDLSEFKNKAEYNEEEKIILRKPVKREGKEYAIVYYSNLTNEVRYKISKLKDLSEIGKVNTFILHNCIKKICVEKKEDDFILPTFEEVSAFSKFDRVQIEDKIGNDTSLNGIRNESCPFCSADIEVNVGLFDFLF